MTQKQALVEKRPLNTIWKRALNQRKQQRYQQIRNTNMASFYKGWLETDSFIPKKFRPKPFPEESEEESRLRLDSAKERMKTEANLCSFHADRHSSKCSTIDNTPTTYTTHQELYEG